MPIFLEELDIQGLSEVFVRKFEVEKLSLNILRKRSTYDEQTFIRIIRNAPREKLDILKNILNKYKEITDNIFDGLNNFIMRGDGMANTHTTIRADGVKDIALRIRADLVLGGEIPTPGSNPFTNITYINADGDNTSFKLIADRNTI